MTEDAYDGLLEALQFFDRKLVITRRPEANYSHPAEGLASMRNLTPEEENQSRKSISRLLRSSKPPRELLDRLAGVFAPDGEAEAGLRRANLVYRDGHRPSDLVHAVQLIVEVETFRDRGMGVEEARAAVAMKHGITESAVEGTLEHWSELRKSVLKTLHPEK